MLCKEFERVNKVTRKSRRPSYGLAETKARILSQVIETGEEKKKRKTSTRVQELQARTANRWCWGKQS